MSIRIEVDDRGRVVTVNTKDSVDVLNGHVLIIRKRRASFVEPASFARRVGFHVLRKLFGDEGRVAAWTRSWRCLWRVRIIGGPVLRGVFESRERAIQRELEWLYQNGSGE